MPSPEPIIVTLSPEAEPLAMRIAGSIAAQVHRAAQEFDNTGSHLRALFSAGHPIVGICASGILIRCLAPLVAAKDREPPVLAVAEDGSAIVPLLGGHSGANDLARKIGHALDRAPAITTAGDLALGVALDSPPPGWRLEPPHSDLKPVMAALIAGDPATLSGSADWIAPLRDRPNVRTGSVRDEDGILTLIVEGAGTLVYRQMRYALGVGCSRFCPPEELIALVNSTLAEAGLSIYEVAGIWSLDLKADEAAIHALADNLGVSARFFDATTLEQETPRLSAPSERVFKEVGCHGVAEGAALAAAGPDAELTVTKRRSASATCAVARIGQGGANGRPRGRLAIVGIGPGQSDWRTPEASRLIAESDEIVGYRLYLDLLCPLAKSRSQKTFPLGAEEERCRYALDRAGEGRKVALVCSGDAGIYAMGALVMELLENSRDGTDLSTAARRVEIISVPGITAMQAASARAGALLGHDFCAISLSDLMTPRDTILSRVRAAAEGDFVIAFYNPVSKRRRTLLDEAKRLLLRHRPAETPVILSTSVGRCDERHQATTLGQLSSEAADMLTVVLVGSSTSRAVWLGDQAAGIAGQMFFTPRGYLDKGAVLSA